jgi:hypothetical protein
MGFSDALLGFFIFLGLTIISFLAFLIKGKFFSARPDENKACDTDANLSQAPSFESHEMQTRYIQQDMVVSSDTNVSDM